MSTNNIVMEGRYPVLPPCDSYEEKTNLQAHLDDPGAVGKGHDVPFLPEEGRVGPLDHLKLAELLHGVNLLRGLVTDLHQRGEGPKQKKEI